MCKVISGTYTQPSERNPGTDDVVDEVLQGRLCSLTELDEIIAMMKDLRLAPHNGLRVPDIVD